MRSVLPANFPGTKFRAAMGIPRPDMKIPFDAEWVA